MRSLLYRFPSNATVAGAATLLILTSIAPGAVVGLPPAGAAASASAMETDMPLVEDSRSSAMSADAAAESTGPDEVSAAASATRGGAVRSRSSVSAASGTNAPSSAAGSGSWTETFTTAGVDPMQQVPLLASVHIDGAFDYLNNNSGAGAGDIFASVDVLLVVHTEGGASTVFDGSARLDSPATFPNPPELVRTGDWADPARDGDFMSTSCGAFFCSYDIATDIVIPAGLVPFGETFAVEFMLSTAAGVHASFETEASSDFFNTGTVVISTPLDGVVVRPIDAMGTIPEPSRTLLAAGAMGIIVLGRRRRDQRRSGS